MKSILIATIPIIGIYQIISGVTLLYIAFFPIIIIDYMVNSKCFTIKNNIIYLFLFIILINLINYNYNFEFSTYSTTINNTIQIAIVAIICTYILSTKFSIRLTSIYLYSFGIITSIIAIIQSISINLYNTAILFFLPLELTDRNVDNISINWGRPNSLFLEPAHYAIYTLPIIFISLLNRKYYISSILSIGAILSTSSTAILGLIVLYVFYLVRSKKSKYLLILPLILLIFLGINNNFIQNSVNYSINKILETDIFSNIRIFGNYKVFEYMNFRQILLGLGHNQLIQFMEFKDITNSSNYSNSIFMSIFSFGILGFILVFSIFYNIGKKTKIELLIIILLVIFTDQILFNQNFIFLISILTIFKKQVFPYENTTSNKQPWLRRC